MPVGQKTVKTQKGSGYNKKSKKMDSKKKSPKKTTKKTNKQTGG